MSLQRVSGLDTPPRCNPEAGIAVLVELKCPYLMQMMQVK